MARTEKYPDTHFHSEAVIYGTCQLYENLYRHHIPTAGEGESGEERNEKARETEIGSKVSWVAPISGMQLRTGCVSVPPLIFSEETGRY